MNRKNALLASLLCTFAAACEGPAATSSAEARFAPVTEAVTDVDGVERTLRVLDRHEEGGAPAYVVRLDDRAYSVLLANSAESSFVEVRDADDHTLASVETFDGGLARLQTADGRELNAFGGLDLLEMGQAVRDAVPADVLTLMSEEVLDVLDDAASTPGLETAHRALRIGGGALGNSASQCSSQDGKVYCFCPEGTYCKSYMRDCSCAAVSTSAGVIL